jgi:catechol 2,3-dioxygenase-like lactoylglutathione lyase family enzyme
MTSAISKLLETYENGRLSRRELVQGLALLAASSSTASAAGFQGNTINHVSLAVSDVQKSTDFYQRVFGATIHKREGNNQVFFGKSFFVLRPGKPTGRVDHVAIGVDNFNEQAITADLKARGATPIPSTAANKALGLGFHVVDPDGFPLQMVSSSNTGRG